MLVYVLRLLKNIYKIRFADNAPRAVCKKKQNTQKLDAEGIQIPLVAQRLHIL
jgi:hypothetical protein